MKSIRIALAAALLCSTACHLHRHALSPAKQDNSNCDSKTSAQLSPEDMKKAWEKAGTPGPSHQLLKPLVGRFTTKVKACCDPNGKPEITKGTSQNQWVLGGRFIEENYAGKMMGKPFQGRGLLGYDNTKSEYVSVWTDTMMTGVMNQKGTYDKAKNAIIFQGEYTDPVSGHTTATKSVTTIANNDKHTFEMFETAPNGQEFKSLEIEYNRIKAHVAKPVAKAPEAKAAEPAAAAPAAAPAAEQPAQ